MKTKFKEIDINEIKNGIIDKKFTVKELVEYYLDRINKFDREGPKINSIININNKALDEAERLDKVAQSTGHLAGPLHGIPIVIKDQVETRDIPTTFGSIAFKNYQPTEDATIIKKLKNAGAIILAKTNLPDFATAWSGVSSVLGMTKNPYKYDRDSGGSSAGTAVAVASNFTTVGVGEDTGGSIRVPSLFNNVYGLRVTAGLISRNRTSPLVGFQDTTGPIARNVSDLSILLDSMIGFDSTDEYSAINIQYSDKEKFSNNLSRSSLEGKRIGIVREAFGSDSDPDSEPVNKVIEKALKALEKAGATLIDSVEIKNLNELTEKSALYLLQSRYDINKFLSTRKTEDGIYTVERLVKEKKFSELLDLFKGIADGPAIPSEVPDYYEKLNSQSVFRRHVLYAMSEHDLDAVVFPDVKVIPPTWKEVEEGKWTVLTFPTNTLIGSQTILPAISMPAGFTNDGIPVGVELLGKQYSEKSLIDMAYAYETTAKTRKSTDF